MNFIAGFKKVTHGIAVAGTAAIGWAYLHPTVVQAVIQAIPKFAPYAGAAGVFLAALYHDSKSNPSSGS